LWGGFGWVWTKRQGVFEHGNMAAAEQTLVEGAKRKGLSAMKLILNFLKLILLLLFASCHSVGPQYSSVSADKLPDTVSYAGELANPQIQEASGLAPSRLNSEILWTVNDSGGDPILYAVSTTGADLGTLKVAGAKNRDWEDLATFKLNDTAYLLIADIGDNKKKRQDCTLYVIKEPNTPPVKFPNDAVVQPAWYIRFKYEDGPRDSESVAVDIRNQRILLLSKRLRPNIIYELPLQPQENSATMVARRLVSVPNISTPTAMDMSADSLSLAILTYTKVYLYTRKSDEKWSEAILRPPQELSFPALVQQEALCFSLDGKAMFVTTEQIPAPLIHIDLQKTE